MSQEKFTKRNLKVWEDMLDNLFDNRIPTQASWEKLDDIIDICNIIGKDHNLNHTFFPGGGGLDLYGAGTSTEEDCIELYFGSSGRSANIIRPDKLIFQSFDAPYEWAYFRIDTFSLAPRGVYRDYQGMDEELTEITPGYYVDRTCWDYGYYNHGKSGKETPLPKEARLIVRHFGGAFVIFAKGSLYNRINGTYDGRHSKMTAEEFRDYIKKNLDSIKPYQD